MLGCVKAIKLPHRIICEELFISPGSFHNTIKYLFNFNRSYLPIKKNWKKFSKRSTFTWTIRAVF